MVDGLELTSGDHPVTRPRFRTSLVFPKSLHSRVIGMEDAICLGRRTYNNASLGSLCCTGSASSSTRSQL
ncbi:hypothetical protein PYCCODRAFT_1277283 [Trametes coccinea BRFM310]|uniref:Uncharacterized protein n=1 Tax=Trametes coccinea (strain BRFM310) TaxID=1353009 RepID=A0A1Y2IV61_TRAC3|nr:hypothetical protein PYCCODRAFT_1277283 [Trametes coccinea BRFM310]